MQERNQPLDILRGVAILLVLGFHYSYFHWWWQIGWTGVDLFFVLSGYLISGLLFNELRNTGTIKLRRFWIRRGFKIYPPYFILAVLTAVSFEMTMGAEPHGMIDEFLFIQNYGPHIWPHTWSLAVEEHFYFVLPVMLWLLRKRRRAMPWVFASIAIVCLAARVFCYHHGVSANTIQSETHLRLDSLMCGVALQYWRTFHSSSFSKLAAGPCWFGAGLIVPAFLLPHYGWFFDTFGLTALYCGYGLLLAWAVDKPRSPAPIARALAWIGRHSYSIYLWHMPILAMIFHGSVSFSFLAFGLAASISFGVLLSKAIEIPSLAIRDRLFPGFGNRPAPFSTVS